MRLENQGLILATKYDYYVIQSFLNISDEIKNTCE